MELFGRCIAFWRLGWISSPNLHDTKALAISSSKVLGGSQQRPDHKEPYELAKKGKLDPLNSGKTWKTFK